MRRVNFQVENTRVGGRTDLDRLVLEIQTDGTISPSDALAQAAQILIQQFAIFSDLGQAARRPEKATLGAGAIPPRIYDMAIEQLELSSRTYNCLKRSQITKVGQILEMSEGELLSLRNFGHKSLTELRERLASLGVSLESTEEADMVDLGDDVLDDEGDDVDTAPLLDDEVAEDRYVYALKTEEEEQ
jgi:DNA-directed RNA polymerase subunit alpha